MPRTRGPPSRNTGHLNSNSGNCENNDNSALNNFTDCECTEQSCAVSPNLESFVPNNAFDLSTSVTPVECHGTPANTDKKLDRNSLAGLSSSKLEFREQALLLEEEEVNLRKAQLDLSLKMKRLGMTETPLLSETQRAPPQCSLPTGLPRLEIEPFDGSPSEYSSFLNAFETHVVNKVPDPSERLAYLIYYCRGPAKDSIRDCVLLPKEQGFDKALSILKCQFGKPHHIIETLTKGLFEGPQIRTEDVKGLQRFVLQMQKCSVTLNSLGREADLNCTVNLVRIVKRLPRPVQIKWAEFAETKFSIGLNPTFNELLALVNRQLSIVDTEFGRLIVGDDRREDQFRKYETRRVMATQMEHCVVCKGSHGLAQCDSFLSLDVKGRWNLLRDSKRCFKCLTANHRIRDCKSNTRCTVSGCRREHHPLLHIERAAVESKRELTSHVYSTYRTSSSRIKLGFVPVRLCGPNGSAVTYAFIDSGSDCTLVTKCIADSLGLKQYPSKLSMSTLHGTQTTTCAEAKVLIESLSESFSTMIDPAIVVETLPVMRVDKDEGDMGHLPHLRDVPFISLQNRTVGILVGCDVPEAHWVTEQRVGDSQHPFANKSPFGWILRGPIKGYSLTRVRVNALISNATSVSSLLEKLYNTEFSDVTTIEESKHSVEDEEAINIAQSSIKLIDGRYEVGVPWKLPRIELPNNESLALRRLNYLMHRLNRDEQLCKSYADAIQDYLDKGYVTKVDASAKRWYLPHHPVVNVHKPNKVRIVFDCAARYGNVSLNDALLKGPDLTNALTGVLLRFRKHPVALAADIREMFLRVRLPEADRWAFSFLWSPKGVNQPHEVYQWNVHPFGATSSPFCANYALKRVAADNKATFREEVSQAVLRNFYVDDFLASVETTEKALALAKEMKLLLSKGGFDLVKWVSNDREVLREVAESDVTSGSVILCPKDSCQRTLGVNWRLGNDTFTFEVSRPKHPYSRRTVLSFVASIYDPLGFIAPVIFPGKRLLQEVCREGLGWDCPLPSSFHTAWSNWHETLSQLSPIAVPRCYLPTGATVTDTELHVFSDASETGYGTVGYVRYSLADGKFWCSFLMGKSRVAPLKFVTVPRLELTAAVLSAQMMKHLLIETDLIFHRVCLWTDSAVVLRYLKSTSKRFATFVANRVQRIRELTSCACWRYVPTTCNPADVASRGVPAVDSKRMELWLKGPDFLWKGEESWPTDIDKPHILDDELEMKKTVMALSVHQRNEWFEELCDQCASWMHLLKRIAWLTRFKTYLQIKLQGRTDKVLSLGVIKLNEINEAELVIIRLVQLATFSSIVTGGVVYPNELRRLKPIVERGVMCLGGRVPSLKPKLMIIPVKHRVTDLIVEHYHRMVAHSGATCVLATIRKKYWLVKGMATVRRILSKCTQCRLLESRPCQQSMAPLPPCRTDLGTYPFKYCGLDYFGPFQVKCGRKASKRFGCLFTCMQSRAIHIEIAHSMSTDSFLMALVRFISRRGAPEDLYSDNGSNFVGADSELKRNLETVNQKRIIEGLHVYSVNWHFNPPMSSHRGGAWERIIRTVRKALRFVVSLQTVTEEVLLTGMAEVERVVNDRPLVPVYDDPDQEHILRPSDLLLLKPSLGIVNDTVPLRDRFTKAWRQAQHISNVFWKRWRRDYLPTLQSTNKWLKPSRNLKVGDLVLIMKTDTLRGHWPKGVVVDVHPGVDTLVRQVSIKTGNGIIRRDVRSVCLLEGADE